MSKIKWDQVGERTYRTGVDHGVLYPMTNGAYSKAVPWSGLTEVNKQPSGAESTKLYADNMQYLNLISAESLGLSISCYTYPAEFAECNGETTVVEGVRLGQQRRNTFGFSYRNKIGNDVENEDFGFEITIVYGCTSSPSEQANQSINDSPEATTFQFNISTTPATVSGTDADGKPYRPVASITIDSTKISKEKLTLLEEILYGKDGDTSGDGATEGRLPLPDELIALLKADGV